MKSKEAVDRLKLMHKLLTDNAELQSSLLDSLAVSIDMEIWKPEFFNEGGKTRLISKGGSLEKSDCSVSVNGKRYPATEVPNSLWLDLLKRAKQQQIRI